jgi:hypothetical protein
LARAADAAAARVAEIKADLERATAAHAAAREALLSRGRQAEKRCNDIDARLEKDADGRIGELIEDLQRRLDEVRHSAGSPHMARHEQALRAGIQRARALQLEATAEIEAALTELRSSIPSKFEAAA